MRRDTCVVGIDPSSKKLAVTLFLPETLEAKSISYKLRQKSNDTYSPKVAHTSFSTVEMMVHKFHLRGRDTRVYMEAPVVGRGGAKSTMVQSYVSGAVQAAFLSLGIPVSLVNVSVWKKDVTGSGAATKDAIASAVHMKLVDMGLNYLWRNIEGDQDMIDSVGVMLYGYRVLGRASQLNMRES